MIKVTCAIIFQKGKVLITQRGEHPHHAFQWEFPGGKVKPEETEAQCLIREIKEELELDVEIAEKMTAVDFDYGFKKIRLIPFLCYLKKGNIVLHEHVDFEWVGLIGLRDKNISGADKEVIALPENQELLEEYSRKKVNDAG